MPDPIVTVVTPSYNQGNFIRATIESVLSQDYPNVEYIIMDGGSTDETASVVRDYASRLTFISEKDRGQSHAINKGFRMARGSILAWLNSDDVYLPGAIRNGVEGFSRDPAPGAVYGEGYLMDRDGKITCRFPHTIPANLWRLTHVSDYILQQSVYFRKDILDEVGYLDEDLHYAMDWEILIRIGKRHPLGYIPEYMGCLREYAEAKSSSGGARRVREIRGHAATPYRQISASRIYSLWLGYPSRDLSVSGSGEQRYYGPFRESWQSLVKFGAGLTICYMDPGILQGTAVRGRLGWSSTPLHVTSRLGASNCRGHGAGLGQGVPRAETEHCCQWAHLGQISSWRRRF